MKALCYSEEYVYRYIDTEGSSVEPIKADEIRIKDKNWWLDGEIADFECA
jgi:hypothetical protein